MTPRAVYYARVSTKEQAEGFSIEAQRSACEKHIAAEGWELAGVFVDRGESARTAARPEFQGMMAVLREDRSIRFMVVHKLDRLARNMVDHVEILAELKSLGVQPVSLSERFDDTPAGRFLVNVMGAHAAMYSEQLAAEVKKGMYQRVEEGGWCGVAPVGYKNIREDGLRKNEAKIIPEEPQATMVRRAFEIYATAEYSTRELGPRMAELGLRSRRGLALTPGQMQHILANPIYRGRVRWGGIERAGNHEPLVSEALFTRVQAVLTSKRSGTKTRLHNHYLKGLLFCQGCGARLCTTTAKGHLYAFCLGRQRRRGCHEPYTPMTGLEEEVESLYFRVRLPDQVKAEIRADVEVELRRRLSGQGSDQDRAQARLAELSAKRDRLLEAFYEGLPREKYRQEQAKISSEEETLKTILAAGGLIQPDRVVAALEMAYERIDDCRDAYLRAKPHIRRLWNRAIFKGVWVGEKRVASHEFAEPFSVLLRYESSSMEDLVTPDERNSNTTGAHSSSIEDVVDPIGLEPTASAMRTQRSPS